MENITSSNSSESNSVSFYDFDDVFLHTSSSSKTFNQTTHDNITTFDDNSSFQRSDKSYFGLIILSIVILFMNLWIIIKLKNEKTSHGMNITLLISLSILHVISAISFIMIGLLMILTGYQTNGNNICHLWTIIDLFLCNNICLHLAFIYMDSYFRLKERAKRGYYVTKGTKYFWCLAPWITAGIQSIAQYFLLQKDEDMIANMICVILDRNFVILGCVFSFLTPSLASLVFCCLCFYEVNTIKLSNSTHTCFCEGRFYHCGLCNFSLDDLSESLLNYPRYALSDNQPLSDFNQIEQTDCYEHTSSINVINHDEQQDDIQYRLDKDKKDFDMITTPSLLVNNSVNSDDLLCSMMTENFYISIEEYYTIESFNCKVMGILFIVVIFQWTPLNLSNLIHCLFRDLLFHSMTFERKCCRFIAYVSLIFMPCIYSKSFNHICIFMTKIAKIMRK